MKSKFSPVLKAAGDISPLGVNCFFFVSEDLLMTLLGFDKTMGVVLKGKVGAELLVFLVRGDYLSN